MTTTKKEPYAETQSSNSDLFQHCTSTDCKGTKNFENPTRQRLFELFLSGGKYSVVQLVLTFHIPDPRSHIRYIRQAGIPISDYWIKSEFSRYKVYFLSKIGG